MSDTRAEDTDEALGKAMTWMAQSGAKAARQECARIAAEVRRAHPGVRGAELDALVMEAIDRRVAAEAAARVPCPPVHERVKEIAKLKEARR